MSAFKTAQERVDYLTMKIDNPNVVGSGYIQFPPQKAFEKPVTAQPPTVAHLDFPEQYQDYLRKQQAATSAGQAAPPRPAVQPVVPRPPVQPVVPRPAVQSVVPRPAPTGYSAAPQRTAGPGYAPQRAPGAYPQYVSANQGAPRPGAGAYGQPAYRPVQPQQAGPYGGRPVTASVGQGGPRPGYRQPAVGASGPTRPGQGYEQVGRPQQRPISASVAPGGRPGVPSGYPGASSAYRPAAGAGRPDPHARPGPAHGQRPAPVAAAPVYAPAPARPVSAPIRQPAPTANQLADRVATVSIEDDKDAMSRSQKKRLRKKVRDTTTK